MEEEEKEEQQEEEEEDPKPKRKAPTTAATKSTSGGRMPKLLVTPPNSDADEDCTRQTPPATRGNTQRSTMAKENEKLKAELAALQKHGKK